MTSLNHDVRAIAQALMYMQSSSHSSIIESNSVKGQSKGQEGVRVVIDYFSTEHLRQIKPRVQPRKLSASASLAAKASLLTVMWISTQFFSLPAPANSHHYREQYGDIPNFHRVSPYLFRGGEPTSAGLEQLKDMGVKTIIDLRGYPDEQGSVNQDKLEAQKLNLHFLAVPMSVDAVPQEKVDSVMREIKAAKSDRNNSVYIHCKHGSDRTGLMVALWRIDNDGWSYKKAHKEMIKYSFNPEYVVLAERIQLEAQKVKGTNIQ